MSPASFSDNLDVTETFLDDFESTPDDHDLVVILNSSVTMTTEFFISFNYSLPTMIIVATVLFLVIIATAIGNLLVGLALFRYQHLRTISNYLIGNLALSDFLLATTIFPLSTVNECLGHWVFGRAMCNIWLLTDVLYCTASLWNICVIAFDRFTATLYPIWYREKRSNRQAAMYVATVWTIATSICVPPLLGWNDLSQNYVHDNATDVYRCILFQTPSYVLYSASGSFFVPFFLTVFLYVQIFIVLRKRMAKMRKMKRSGGHAPSAGAAAAQAAKHAERRNNGGKQAMLSDTELEMTAIPVVVREKTKAAADEASLKSCLSSDSAEDPDPNLPLQRGKRRLLRAGGGSAGGPGGAHSKDRTRETREGKTRCSVRFLTGLKLANWARPSRNGVLYAFSTDSARGRRLRRSAASNDQSQKVDTDNDIDNITTKLVEEEEEDDDRTACGKSAGGSGGVERRRAEGGGVGGGRGKCLEELKRGRTSRRPCHSLITRIFKHRAWSSSSLESSRQGSTTSSRSISASTTQTQRQQQQRRFDQKEIQATIRMAIIIAFFCGMWLGFFAVYVIQGWCPDCFVPRELEAFFFWLGYSNSSINPILYTIFNEDFRKAFQKILGCYRTNQDQNAGSSSTPKH